MISVIVPVFNVEKFLHTCLDSIACQTYEDFEVVLVDDGSTDSSGQICDSYLSDKRFRVIHKENGGVSSARNVGLDNAQGEYLCFVDSDDCINPDYLKHLKDLMDTNCVDISITGFCVFENDPPDYHYERTKSIVCSNWKALEKVAVNYLFLVPWGKLYKRKVFDNIRYPLGVNHEDEYVAHLLYMNSEMVAYDNNIMYYYRKTPNSIMNADFSLSRLSAVDAIEKRLKFYQENHKQKLCKITVLELVSMYQRNVFYLMNCKGADKYVRDQEKKYFDMLNNSSYRISIFKYPELYIHKYPKLKKVFGFLRRIKHSLGLVCW